MRLGRLGMLLAGIALGTVVKTCAVQCAERESRLKQERHKFLQELAEDNDGSIAFAKGSSIGLLELKYHYSSPKFFEVHGDVESLAWDSSGKTIYYTTKEPSCKDKNCKNKYLLIALDISNRSNTILVDSCVRGFSELNHLRYNDGRLYFKTGPGCASIKTDGSELREEPFLQGGEQVSCRKGRHNVIIEDYRVKIRNGFTTLGLDSGGTHTAVWSPQGAN